MLRASAVRRSSVPEFNFGHSSLKRNFGNMVPVPRVPAKPTPIEKSVMANGVTIVTKDNDGSQTAIGIYAEAGPKFDPLAAPGLSYVMRSALMTSNMDTSIFQIDRTCRAVGNAYGSCDIRKQFIGLKTEGRRDKWQEPFATFATGIVIPRFDESDIERFRDNYDNLLDELRWQNPRVYAADQLETVAFYKEPLGMPRMVPENANDKVTSEKLLTQWARLFKPKNITIAAVNVKHEELVAAYAALPYTHSEDAPHFQRGGKSELSQLNESLQFTPGNQRFEYEDRSKEMGTRPNMEEDTVIAVGWPTFGRDESAKAFAIASVIQQLLEMNLGTSKTIAPNASGATAFYRPYSTAGLIGIAVNANYDVVVSKLRDACVRFPKTASDEEIAMAIGRAQVSFFSEELELARDQVDFLATSKFSAEEIVDAINSVKNAEVLAALAKIRSVEPAMFVTGKIHTIPSLKNIGLKW